MSNALTLILLANIIGSLYCTIRLSSIYKSVPSDTWRNVARPNILFSFIYFLIFVIRILSDGVIPESISDIGTIVAILVWHYCWTRPLVALAAAIKDEYQTLRNREARVVAVEKIASDVEIES